MVCRYGSTDNNEREQNPVSSVKEHFIPKFEVMSKTDCENISISSVMAFLLCWALAWCVFEKFTYK